MKKNRIIAFGDSIIKGVVIEDATPSKKYHLIDETLTDYCAKTLGRPSLNYGSLGCTIDKGEQVLDRNLQNIEPTDIVLLEFGGNDANYKWHDIAKSPAQEHSPLTPLSMFAAIYQRIIRKVMDVGAVPVVLSLPPIDVERYFWNLSQDMNLQEQHNILRWLDGSLSNIEHGHELYNLETMKVAHRMLVPWIDITSAFLQDRNYKDYLCADGLHPNERGQRLIAKSVLSTLNKAEI